MSKKNDENFVNKQKHFWFVNFTLTIKVDEVVQDTEN